MKKLWNFIRAYKLFAVAAIGASVALGLELGELHTAAKWVLIAAIAIETVPLVWGMIQDVRHGKYGVDILAATAIITAVVMGEHWAAMVIVLMLTGGEALEDYAERRAHRELDALLTRAPQKAHVLRGRKIVDVPARSVEPGDKIVVRPGEVVPVDAEIMDGVASLDESSLTGESLPAIKKAGSQILSGSVNLDGVITARALHNAKDSQYEQIIRLVENARKSQAPFVRLADHYAVPFTILSFGIAGAAWIISGDSLRFLQVLVVATPCPLILAAPIAIISGMSRAAKQGVIIKNGSALERLAEAKAFAFDKTGTLTAGEPAVDQVKTFNTFRAGEVLAIAASLEQNSNHVLAHAIVTKATAAGHKKIMKAKHVKELSGNGLRAMVGGKEVLVGRLALLAEHEVQLPKSFHAKDFQQTAAFVSIGGKLAGVITFRDDVRPESKQTLRRLKALGVRELMMVTGDARSTARAIARKIGITTVHAEALPGDKIRAIETAQHRPIAFVGDGVNDAPVLTASDVGIALGARGSTAASESADIVVMPNDLSRVADARAIARGTFAIAKQSIFIGIGLSVALMLIFSTGKFKPIYGALIQELVDVVVIINALRAHSRHNDN